MENKRNKIISSKVVHTNPFFVFFGVLATMVSWFYNHSVFWAILHYLIAPIYLIYCILAGRFADGNFMNIIHHYF